MGRIRLLIGVVISLGLLFLTIRGLNWEEVLAASRTANYSLIVLSAVFVLASFGFRAIRWSYLLSPVRKLSSSSLFSVVLIGFFGNYILPAKTGELLRAYVLGKREQMSKSAILGSIAVEKTIDAIILFVILLATLWAVPLPSWISDFEQGAAVILIVIVFFMFLLAARGRFAISLVIRALQFVFPWWKERVAKIANSFVEGLGVLNQGSSLIAVTLLSAAIWLLTTANFYLIGTAIGFNLPLYVYVIIVAVTNMASLAPSMPGRLGTLEFLSVTVLGLFGVSPNSAVLFPIMLRVVQLLPILLGYLFLNQEGVRILDVQREIKQSNSLAGG